MSRKCQLTGKGPQSGNHVSHANNKRRRVFKPNIQTKRIFVPSENRTIKMKLSTKAIRLLDKKGADVVWADFKAGKLL